MSQPNDIQTAAQLKASLLSISDQELAKARADRAALLNKEDSSLSAAYGADARAELVAQDPALDGILSPTHSQATDSDFLTGGSSAFDLLFQNIQQQILAQMPSGANQFMALMLKQAIELIDELREINDEMAVEAAQLGIAAASGLLVPPTQDDLEDYSDEVRSAQDQARFVSRDLANGERRRTAVRTRRLTQTDAASEAIDNPEVDGTFTSPGDSVDTRATTSDAASEQLQSLLRAPILNRVGYVVICTALAQLARTKDARGRAVLAANKLKALIDQIKRVLEDGFLGTMQESIQERANEAVAGVVSQLQSKLDAIDAFTKTIAGLPGPFVSTVTAVGDIADTSPLLASLSTLCGIKGQRFCDFQGLLEIAASIDSQLGLKFPRLPMVGRVELELVVPDEQQVAPVVVVPGQEASLMLAEPAVVGARRLFARFTAEDRQSAASVGGPSVERGDVFGTGPGSLTLTSPGTQAAEQIDYSSVTFSDGVYDFALVSPLTRAHERWFIGNADSARIVNGSFVWDDTVAFPPGAPLRFRMSTTNRGSDLFLPVKALLGNNETWVRAGTGVYLGAGVIEAAEPNTGASRTFRAWHVGQTITVNGVESVITDFIDGGVGPTAFDGVEVSPAPSIAIGARVTVRLALSQAETVTVQAVSQAPGLPTVLNVTTTLPTTKDHGRLLLTPLRTVRVVPEARADFLDPGLAPANGSVRTSVRNLPQGSTTVRAQFADPAQAAIFTPILDALEQGRLTINGGPDLEFSSVTVEPSGILRFAMTAGTPAAALAGSPVLVETTSMLDQFQFEFPSDWSDPIDDQLRSLLVLLNRIESQFCRLLSGSSQDIATNCALLVTAATASSFALTGFRFLLVAWLAPLLITDTLTAQLERLQALGADRAAKALRDGRIDDFVAMKPADSTSAGAIDGKVEAIRAKINDEKEFAAYAAASAEVAGRHQSTMMAGVVMAGIEDAQRAELARREQGAINVKRLAEDISV